MEGRTPMGTLPSIDTADPIPGPGSAHLDDAGLIAGRKIDGVLARPVIAGKPRLLRP